MKKIYFVRHGQSQANIDGIAAGAEFDSPLTDKGRAQAKEVTKALINKDINLIVCSPLTRAKETAEIIAKGIGYDTKKLVTSPYFIERGLGIYANRPLSLFIKDYQNGTLHESVESVPDLVDRVAEGLNWLATQQPKDILLVSHSDVSDALRLINNKLPHNQLYEREELGNAKIYEFDL